jgi:V/A-type H+-transporting ATPase subunit B
MKDGIGEKHTREDHKRVAGQIYASYARALEVRNLASIIGAEDLSEIDRNYLDFGDAFEQRFVGQREDEERSVVETLNLAWELLSLLPPQELTRVATTDLEKHHHWQGGTTETT